MAAWAVLVKATFRLYKAAVLGCFHNIKNFHSVVSTDCYTLPLVQLYVLAVTHTRAVRVVLTPLIYNKAAASNSCCCFWSFVIAIGVLSLFVLGGQKPSL